MTGKPIIELNGLTRRDARTERVILDRVSLTIAAGERIGLVGPSGSGKTSLLRAIARLDSHDGGRIEFGGAAVEREAVPAYRRRVIYLSQQPAFRPTTVRENLELVYTLGAVESAFDPRLSQTWLDQLGKPVSMLDQSIESLSGGEQQIVSLIRALMLSPIVLLLDEPTAALDADSIARFEQLVTDWHAAAPVANEPVRALVWSSHDATQVQRMTDRQLRMNQGQLAIA